ncbi:hypothetical protein [Butyrivibrio sp. WCD2001]|uniref:hypothetical protein n=1 Tax=Butyrivibrio sp. WCD2001 TaxID=1280681 RepID=UPI00041FF224|nr:hypothetical protein [Butyrivibrio sp. WCD2001]
MRDFVTRITSRKFLLCFAAFLASIGASVAGIQSGNNTVTAIGTVCTVLSAAIYAACEAYVDASGKEGK